MNIKYDAVGLLPTVVQDKTTGQVLMVAWMNAEALCLTQDTGLAHFWSRSRQSLWLKGSTSGNYLRVQRMFVDCDGDTLLLQVVSDGPACHTGAQSCFFRELEETMLHDLFKVIEERKANPTTNSYTARLINEGEHAILKKVGEEAIEVILAAMHQGDQRLVEEVADLFYHLLVMLSQRGLTLADVETELASRQ